MKKFLKTVLSFTVIISSCLIFSKHLPAKAASQETMRVQLYRMANVVYNSDTAEKSFNMNGWTYVELIHTSGGLDAVVYKKASPTYSGKYDYCFAFRGTKGGVDIVASDVPEVVLGLDVNQVPSSVSWVKSIISKKKNEMGRVYFTGHSLGGYLAAWVESEVVDGKIDVPNDSYSRTFNAPGINSSQHPIKNTRETIGKYDNYIKNYSISRNYGGQQWLADPVSVWGNRLGKVVLCEVYGNKKYSNVFNYHPRDRWNEILNTSNFPD